MSKRGVPNNRNEVCKVFDTCEKDVDARIEKNRKQHRRRRKTSKGGEGKGREGEEDEGKVGREGKQAKGELIKTLKMGHSQRNSS